MEKFHRKGFFVAVRNAKYSEMQEEKKENQAIFRGFDCFVKDFEGKL